MANLYKNEKAYELVVPTAEGGSVRVPSQKYVRGAYYSEISSLVLVDSEDESSVNPTDIVYTYADSGQSTGDTTTIQVGDYVPSDAPEPADKPALFEDNSTGKLYFWSTGLVDWTQLLQEGDPSIPPPPDFSNIEAETIDITGVSEAAPSIKGKLSLSPSGAVLNHYYGNANAITSIALTSTGLAADHTNIGSTAADNNYSVVKLINGAATVSYNNTNSPLVKSTLYAGKDGAYLTRADTNAGTSGKVAANDASVEVVYNDSNTELGLLLNTQSALLHCNYGDDAGVGVSTNGVSINGDWLDVTTSRQKFLLKPTEEAPTSSSVGETGEVVFGTNGIYVCVDTNTWKYCPLASIV